MFRPERWVTGEGDNTVFDSQFVDDKLKDFHPFSQGPRMCTGREIAWWQIRVFIAKILWKFDLRDVPGVEVDVDKDLRGWGLYEKPEFRVKFLPAQQVS